MSYWINATVFQAVVLRQREGGGESEEEMSVVGWRAQAGLMGRRHCFLCRVEGLSRMRQRCWSELRSLAPGEGVGFKSPCQRATEGLSMSSSTHLSWVPSKLISWRPEHRHSCSLGA